MKMKKTKKLALIAILTALYFVLAAMLKIPIAGHITLDLGYVALTVGAVYLGAVPGMLIGGIGAFLESALLSQRGVSLGWILMNLIVGGACGFVLHKTVEEGRKRFILSALIVIPASMLLGVAVKTLMDCAIYHLALAVKIPTGIAAWVADSAVMLAMGIPMSMALKKRLRLGK